MANAWFRMYHEFATDPKVQMLSESEQRRYVMILCLRCSNDNVTLHDEEVAFQLRISNEDWLQTKAILVAKGLIDDDNKPVAWDKRQSTDSLRLSSEVWTRVRQSVFERDHFTCQYCGIRGARLECDHIIPLSRGGDNSIGNLTTACFVCNRSKGSKLPSEWEGR